MNDVKFAFRQLLKSPGFTLIALVTLTVGIGGNTAMFSLLNAVMLRPLPYPEPEQLVRIYRTSPQSRSWPHSVANHLDHRAQSRSFEHLGAFSWQGYNLAEPGHPPETLRGVTATSALLAALGTRPLLGRTFTPEDDQPGRGEVAILGHAWWQARFAGDTNIIGRVLRLDGAPVTVIGVMPATFDHPLFWGPVDLWRPLVFSHEQRENRASNWLGAIGRLKRGVSLNQAEAELNLVAGRLAKDFPEPNAQDGVRLVPLNRAGMDETGQSVSWMTTGLALFVLLIACANLANLQFARAAARAREYAIRAALGAQRSRLIRQLLTESMLLALIGGGLGLLLAIWLGKIVGRHIWVFDRAGIEVPLSPNIFGFALLASVFAGLGFGILPAWLASRANVGDVLKPAARGTTADRSHHRLRQGLIMGEIAVALVLLTGAGLFIRGLDRFSQRDPGWRVDGLTTGNLALPEKKYATLEQGLQFIQQLEDKMAAIPGVERAALAWSLPVWGFASSAGFVIEDRPATGRAQTPLAYVNGVSPGYFDTLGMTRLQGRDFSPTDHTNAPLVVVINETMARHFWPGENPIGKRIGNPAADHREWREIIGVVGDVQFTANFSQPETRFQMYRPLAQEPRGYLVAVLRSAVAPDILAGTLRQSVAQIDPDQPVYDVGTARQSAERILKNYTLTGWLLAGFAALGLFLAGVGIYGMIAGFVTQRTGEIGIRMALGAPMRNVLWLVLGQGMRIAAGGTVIGLAGAFGLGRLLTAVAPELPAPAPTTIAGVAGMLIGVSLLACWLPARRAARVDPMVALRSE